MSNVTPDYEIRIIQERGTSMVSVIGGMPEELRMDNSSTWEAPFSQGLMGMLPGSISSALKMFGVKPATQQMTLQVWQGTEGADLTFDLVFNTQDDPIKDVQKPVIDLLSMVVPSVDDDGFIMTPGPSLDPSKARELAITMLKQAGQAISAIPKIFSAAFDAGKDVGNVVADAAISAVNGTTVDLGKNAIPSVGMPARQAASRKQAISLRENLASTVKNRISITFGRFLSIRDVVVVAANPVWDMSYLDALTGLPNVCTVSVTIRPLFAVTMQDLQEMFHVADAAPTPVTGGQSKAIMNSRFDSLVNPGGMSKILDERSITSKLAANFFSGGK